MTTWLLIGILAVATITVKSIGPALAGGRRPPAAVERVIALFTPALIAALVVSNTFADGRQLVVDARAAGVAVGLIALLLRAPILVAGVLGAITCAATRMLLG